MDFEAALLGVFEGGEVLGHRLWRQRQRKGIHHGEKLQ